MKYILFVILLFSLIACQSSTQDKVELKNQKDSVSYSIGLNIGNNFKSQMIDVNPDIVASAIKDILDSNKTLLTDEEAQKVWMAYQQQLMAKNEEKMKTLGEKNKIESEAFLDANSKKEDVITLPSGLQYKVIQMGTGKKPKETDKVKVHYQGTLVNGTEFDNSYKRGEPASFNVNGVIKGWVEALQLMPVGSKWQLFIPPALAYGERGAGSTIPPSSALIFEVELLSIE